MSDTQPSAQPVTERGNNRSQRPSSEAFRAFMADQWADTRPEVHRDPVADHTPARRERLSELFPGERLVLPAGGLVTRSNDTDYRFRPHSAFSHLSGLGIDREPDAVLVLHPRSRRRAAGTTRCSTCGRWPGGTPRSSSPTRATGSSGSAPARASPTSPSSPASRWSTWTGWPTRWPRTPAPAACGCACCATSTAP